ncbi:MAG: hypothetical protein GF311_24970 [Candidatus Lokiarchaeota archaeon]|nr:hypothetical protein [Candidatus Lokiarchaeota archaeon]
MKTIEELLKDDYFIEKAKKKLPKYIYDLDNASKKDGKLSPDIGTLREKMMSGILKKEYEEDFQDELPPQGTETDFIISNEEISFKTTISKSFKLIWTAYYDQAMQFYKTFQPSCSILVMLFQKTLGGLHYLPVNSLRDIRLELGNKFLKRPKSNTNPRGVALSTKAFNRLVNHEDSISILINWEDIEEG